jgi:phosphopantothenoylcysteine decarboxylase/phosphopantothenate--cysteine ligase
MLHGKRIILGVTGGIAAYKAVEILRELVRRGADVHVVLTANAARFVGPLTFSSLSGHRVGTSMWDDQREQEIEHIALARTAHLVLVAPATANFIAKLAHGLADDLLSSLCLAARCPLVAAPSMNDGMYANAAVQSNLKLLARRGIRIVEPESGPLACATSGTGRLPPAAIVIGEVERALGIVEDLAGLKVTITAGPTREALDPVRFIGNRSSGRMGVALARQAVLRGARVTLVLGPGTVEPPPGADCVRVESAAEMAKAALAAASGCDIFIAAAAVADYAPASRAAAKLKKSGRPLTVTLKPTTDILAAVGRMKKRPFLVGFAAETGDPLPEARRKMKAKGVDLMVANDVSRTDSGFDVGDIQAWLLHGRDAVELPLLTKEEAADRILDRVAALRAGG